MAGEMLRVRGARHHNLRNVSVDIPKGRLVVISGLSGSGKSTLAFDTIYAEGQRRYVESLSAYARQFLEIMDKPDVDSIEGLSPAISIQQKTTSKNPRSTVGTTTEIYDYLRLLYARVGKPHCAECGRAITTQSVDTICDTILGEFGQKKVMVLSPLVRRKKGTHEKAIAQARRDGYSRLRIDGEVVGLDGKIGALDRQKWHSIEIVVDRIAASQQERSRLFEAVQAALKASRGYAMVTAADGKERVFSQSNACSHCGTSIGELEPRTFSFNSPFGMCPKCNGLGVMMEFDADLVIPDKSLSLLDGAIVPWRGRASPFKKQALRAVGKKFGFDLMTPVSRLSKAQMRVIMHGTGDELKFRYTTAAGDTWSYTDTFEGVLPQLKRRFHETESDAKREWLKQFMRDTPCKACGGKKLRPEALAVKVGNMGIMDVCDLPVDECHGFFTGLRLDRMSRQIAAGVLKEIVERLEFLRNVGLDYLTLNRLSSTLSGGESQRIRLATQIGSNLTGVLYVLDEPTIGLHNRDNDRLMGTLTRLRDLGNTVIVVEHDEDMIRGADWVIDLGPGAGVHGGRVVFEGTVAQMLDGKASVTGRYLKDHSIIRLGPRARKRRGTLTVAGASENNLQWINVDFPMGLLIAVTGVSGSGKSTLVNEILLKALNERTYGSREKPGRHRDIRGAHRLDKVIGIDQSPIGRTPRSNPATYIGAFTHIRELFASTELARERGYSPGQFSFNVSAGRCFACEGDGIKLIEMQFLSDVHVKCDECRGARYNSETLAVLYKGKSIADVLDMTVEDALAFFGNVPPIQRKLQTMQDVGLGYIRLGQSSTTLSGGEAQRVKLATELSKRATGRTLYVLDEPTTGLHFADVERLLAILDRLAGGGNTVIVIEHNMDIIRNADWIIDLGPEGGNKGGRIVAEGTPEEVAAGKGHTARYLARHMAR